MVNLNKLIEDTRVRLNTLIESKERITDDKELLELSIILDNLINEYMNTTNNKFNISKKL